MPLTLQIPSKPASLRRGAAKDAARRAGTRTPSPKGLFAELDTTWTAAAFAEENEAATARQILSGRGCSAPTATPPPKATGARTP